MERMPDQVAPPARRRQPSSGAFLVAYVVFLFVVSGAFVFRWPIVAGDTDLWYHLNGGRYVA